MAKPINRRKFLLTAAAGIGASCLACAGLGALGMQPPLDPSFEQISGATNMSKKVLVTYASRAGSTMEVAQTLAQELTTRGFTVDVRPVKQVTSVDGYSAVVIGSAIRMSSPLPEVTAFIEKNQAALNSIPTAYFALYLMNQGEDATSRTARDAYLAPLRKLVKPQAEALFPGVGDMSKVSFLEGLIGRMVKSPEGDFRNWDTIRTWGQTVLA